MSSGHTDRGLGVSELWLGIRRKGRKRPGAARDRSLGENQMVETAPPVLASVYDALKAEHIALLARYNALNEAHKELQAKTPDAKPAYEYAEGECRPVIAVRG